MDRKPSAISRRFFLQGCSALGTLGLTSTIGNLRLINAAAAAESGLGDYKALVCVFLYGGNDSMNLLVPTSEPEYGIYAQDRQNLALPKGSLLNMGDLGDGRTFGMPPETSALRDLFNEGALAFAANVGTLLYPMTKADYLNKTLPRPPQLYSHNDQQHQWQTSIPDLTERSGWGGKMADLLYNLNDNSQLSMSISLAGYNTFQVGDIVSQYHLSSSGSVVGLELPGNSSSPRRQALEAAVQQLILQSDHLYGRAHSAIKQRALDNVTLINDALAQVPDPTTPFPDSSLGKQLKTAARMIKAAPSLGMRRQVFFCAKGGFDTHDDQETRLPALLSDISDSIAAFYRATQELGFGDQVTTFTASDFGRTFNSNGTGSDHGWGSHQLVVGGAVQGRAVYGQIPTLEMAGPDVVGRAFLPTTAVDSYSATLARWFGISAGNLPLVVPNIGRFGTSDMGFMV